MRLGVEWADELRMFGSRRTSDQKSNRRLHARLAGGGLIADLGKVIDVSARGMRLRTTRRWAEGRERMITLRVGDSMATVRARCVWCRQDALLSHTVGLAFQDQGEETVGDVATLLERVSERPAA